MVDTFILINPQNFKPMKILSYTVLPYYPISIMIYHEYALNQHEK